MKALLQYGDTRFLIECDSFKSLVEAAVRTLSQLVFLDPANACLRCSLDAYRVAGLEDLALLRSVAAVDGCSVMADEAFDSAASLCCDRADVELEDDGKMNCFTWKVFSPETFAAVVKRVADLRAAHMTRRARLTALGLLDRHGRLLQCFPLPECGATTRYAEVYKCLKHAAAYHGGCYTTAQRVPMPVFQVDRCDNDHMLPPTGPVALDMKTGPVALDDMKTGPVALDDMQPSTESGVPDDDIKLDTPAGSEALTESHGEQNALSSPTVPLPLAERSRASSLAQESQHQQQDASTQTTPPRREHRRPSSSAFATPSDNAHAPRSARRCSSCDTRGANYHPRYENYLPSLNLHRGRSPERRGVDESPEGGASGHRSRSTSPRRRTPHSDSAPRCGDSASTGPKRSPSRPGAANAPHPDGDAATKTLQLRIATRAKGPRHYPAHRGDDDVSAPTRSEVIPHSAARKVIHITTKKKACTPSVTPLPRHSNYVASQADPPRQYQNAPCANGAASPLSKPQHPRRPPRPSNNRGCEAAALPPHIGRRAAPNSAAPPTAATVAALGPKRRTSPAASQSQRFFPDIQPRPHSSVTRFFEQVVIEQRLDQHYLYY